LSCLYQTNDISLPIGFDLVEKTEIYIDPKDGKQKRRSLISKNELARNQIAYALKNTRQMRALCYSMFGFQALRICDLFSITGNISSVH